MNNASESYRIDTAELKILLFVQNQQNKEGTELLQNVKLNIHASRKYLVNSFISKFESNILVFLKIEYAPRKFSNSSRLSLSRWYMG